MSSPRLASTVTQASGGGVEQKQTRVVTTDKRSVPSATGHISVSELLGKCSELYKYFKDCQDALAEDRDVITGHEEAVMRLQTVLARLPGTLDAMAGKLLTQGVQPDAVGVHISTGDLNQARAQRVRQLRSQRDILEQRLLNVNLAIDAKYDNLYEVREMTSHLKELREETAIVHENHVLALKEMATDMEETGQDITTSTDEVQVSVTDADIERLKAEIEDMNQQQLQVDQHVKEQHQELDVNTQDADTAMKRVFELENKIRREPDCTNDDIAFTTEPSWSPDMCTLSVRNAAPAATAALSLRQTQWLRELQKRKRLTRAHAPLAKSGNPNPVTSIHKVTSEEILRFGTIDPQWT